MKRKRVTGSTVNVHLAANECLCGRVSGKEVRLRGKPPGNRDALTTRRSPIRQNQIERERDENSNAQQYNGEGEFPVYHPRPRDMKKVLIELG